MRYHERDGLKVSQIGVGCYGLSGAYGAKNRAEFAPMSSESPSSTQPAHMAIPRSFSET